MSEHFYEKHIKERNYINSELRTVKLITKRYINYLFNLSCLNLDKNTSNYLFNFV